MYIPLVGYEKSTRPTNGGQRYDIHSTAAAPISPQQINSHSRDEDPRKAGGELIRYLAFSIDIRYVVTYLIPTFPFRRAYSS